MTPPLDAVVVGAGPYGLSVAAHLKGRGRSVQVYGRTLELWRQRMPAGMVLRSQWWATNLSDPAGAYGIERFFRESKHRKAYPLPLPAFIDYGLWFKERAVPDLVDDTMVRSIARTDGVFEITLENGATREARAVVMAIGVYHYANRPEPYSRLPAALWSHSSDPADFTRFRGKDVMVLGGGQSAIEYAALLHEAGARVQVASRRPLMWLDPDRYGSRSLWERIRAPDAQIAAGWEYWTLDKFPYLFWRASLAWKDSYNSNYRSGASDWLRDRFTGKVTLHDGQTIAEAKPSGGRLDLTLTKGGRTTVDHLMLATGFKADLARLGMLDPALRSAIRADQGTPLLDHWFQTSVPGLYFVGFTSIRTFGPLYRFVAGAGAAARRVAAAVARQG